MLKSLFGELGSVGQGDAQRGDFAATAILESGGAGVNDRGQMVDRLQHDLFVTGSPAQAMREHFAAAGAGADVEAASRTITLYDPVRMWAGAVIHALSDASGRPLERLHLRDQATLATLALIERTTLPRRLEDTLKIYHADVRAQGLEAASLPFALMERSHLAAVIVGPMHPATIDGMLAALCRATHAPQWRCPALLFMLPVGAVWIANKVRAVAWPKRLQLLVISEPLTSASAVWNALLAQWNLVKSTPAWDAEIGHSPALAQSAFPIKVAELAAAATAELDAQRAALVLPELMQLEGMLGCAVVDGRNGAIVASEGGAKGKLDLTRAAAAAAEAMRSHRNWLPQFHSEPHDQHVDEVLVTAGQRHHVMRSLAAHPEHFVLAVLDKLRCNLALARFRILEAQQSIR